MIVTFRNKTPKLGKNVYIAETATVIGDVTLGDDVSIWPSAVIRGDVNTIVIGKGSNVQDGAVIHVDPDTKVTIGENVTIGHLAHVHGATIHNNVLIGSTSTVLDNAIIHSNNLIAAGALVSPRTVIESGNLVVGLPASSKRALKESEIEHIQWNAEEYVNLKNEYLNEK
ncbi:MAG TPA: gamma carbonic anhydrase family protein [Erysipelotrichaceae bacterium]|nr:gamma carbonic anhydrase family protein [Erysipelotrichaceae bacterium]